MTQPVLVAPDSFKGTFSAPEVAGAIAAGLRSAEREAIELPVADGGEGTMDVLVTHSAASCAASPLPTRSDARSRRASRFCRMAAPLSRPPRRAGSASWRKTSATPGPPPRAAPVS